MSKASSTSGGVVADETTAAAVTAIAATDTPSAPPPSPPLFRQRNVRKPEYWQFTWLIAPATELPEGKKAWAADDAIGIWCMRCHKTLNFQKGSSQSIRYHMETKHSDDLSLFRSELAETKAEASDTSDVKAETTTAPTKSPANGRGTKRKAPTLTTSTTRSAVSAALTKDGIASSDALNRSVKRQSIDTSSSKAATSVSPPLTRATQPTTTTTAAAVSPVAAVVASPVLSTVPLQPHDAAPLSLPTTTPNSSHGSAATSNNNDNDDANATSWRRNVERRGGFWGNAYWYDLHLQRRMPLADRMLDELVAALPPCDSKRVLDLCAGSGRAAAAVLSAYPTAQLTLVDSSSERLAIAQKRLLAIGASSNTQFVTSAVEIHSNNSNATIANAMPVDVVVACLALHVLAEAPAHYAQSNGSAAAAASSTLRPVVTKDELYERMFALIFRSLAPGGHVVFADHVGQLGLFAQLQAMTRAGFVDVDCAWRQDDSFVAGGRRPLQ